MFATNFDNLIVVFKFRCARFNIYIGKFSAEMVAILEHKMITIATILLAERLNHSAHLGGGKIGLTEMNALPIAMLMIENMKTVK